MDGRPGCQPNAGFGCQSVESDTRTASITEPKHQRADGPRTPSPRQPTDLIVTGAAGEISAVYGSLRPNRDAQARPSNRLVTDPSSNTSRIARLIRGPIDSSVSLSKWRSSGMGRVFVTTTSRATEF